MLLALVALHIVHPGRIMPGKEGDMPSRKQRGAGRRSKWAVKSLPITGERKIDV